MKILIKSIWTLLRIFVDFLEFHLTKLKFKNDSQIIPMNDLKPQFTSHLGFDVYLYDDLLVLEKIPSRIPGAIAAELVNHSFAIFVNRSFLIQPKWFQDAALAHEEGHILLDHLNNPDSIQDEQQADLYAYDQKFNIVQALRHLDQIFFLDTKDRIKYLEAIIQKRKYLKEVFNDIRIQM